MDWGIWLRKAGLGLLAAAGAAAVTYAIAQVTALQTAEGISPWVLVIAPAVLHALGLAANWIKHA